jgi:hypothetical protein
MALDVVHDVEGKKNQIGDHALPQRGFGLSTPGGVEQGPQREQRRRVPPQCPQIQEEANILCGGTATAAVCATLRCRQMGVQQTH